MINELHKIWGVEQYAVHAMLSNLDEFTCYEPYYEQLSTYTKERYAQEPDACLREVFDIYRSVNITPIVYFTEQGLIAKIKELANTAGNQIDKGVLGLGNNGGQTVNRFLFPNMMTAEPKGRGSNSSVSYTHLTLPTKRIV